jgi:hypothetical protein
MGKAEQGMGMATVRGGGNEKAEQGMGMATVRGGGNEKAEQGMGMAEHGMTTYPLLP